MWGGVGWEGSVMSIPAQVQAQAQAQNAQESQGSKWKGRGMH